MDPIFGNVSILARERASRPLRARFKEEHEFSGPCALCPGNEGMCPPEVARIELPVAAGRPARWQTRAFSHRYPALSLEQSEDSFQLSELEEKPYVERSGFGVHEVIVDSGNHELPFWCLDPAQATATLQLVRNRVRDLQKDRRILYTQVFKNHKLEAGPHTEHPHFQLVGMTFLPEPMRRLLGSHECLVCRHLRHELESEEKEPERLFTQSSHFVALADYAPKYPYQYSIFPKRHQEGFGQASDAELEDLSRLFTITLGRLQRLLGPFPLNLILYTQPNPESFSRPRELHPWKNRMHWFVRIYPRLGRHAGLELGTGVSVVHTYPEDAARAFREKGI
jgi:UDPglucose--hexose-1-phosphate uridylyltransferase